MENIKVFLRDDEIPREWYNIMADMPTPMSPPLHPGTGKPVTPQDLAAIFPMNLIEQEVSSERFIRIPDRCWRSTSSGVPRRFTGREISRNC